MTVVLANDMGRLTWGLIGEPPLPEFPYGTTIDKVMDCVIQVKMMFLDSFTYRYYYRAIPDECIVVDGYTFNLGGMRYDPEIIPKWAKLKNEWIATHPRDQFEAQHPGKYSECCCREVEVVMKSEDAEKSYARECARQPPAKKSFTKSTQ